MKKNHLSSMTAATMAFLLAASAPFQAFAEEVNPDSSYSVDQERLTDNQLDYDEIGARVKEYYGPIKSAYNMVRGMTEDQGQIAVNERTMADDLISQARAAEDLAKDQTGMDQMINKRCVRLQIRCVQWPTIWTGHYPGRTLLKNRSTARPTV